MNRKIRSLEMGFLRIDRRRKLPMYLQVYEGIRAAILDGQLAQGTQVLSSRELAEQFQLSRTTVLTAFDQLIAEGYLSTTAGSGTFVCNELPPDRPMFKDRKLTPAKTQQSKAEKPKLSKMGENILRAQKILPPFDLETKPFKPGVPALDEFPRVIWSQLWRKMCKAVGPSDLAYQDSSGCLQLRETIAEYLASHRGVRCDPDQVLITNGTAQSIELCAKLLVESGEEVYVENPGYEIARAIFESHGLKLVPVNVDGDGGQLPRSSNRSPAPRMAYLTPSHQFPLGATLSVERRLEFIEWANQHDSWILEDDYDSEYRYSQKPIPSMQGLDESCRTIYMGSFSKVVFPALGMAYIVVPNSLKLAFKAALSVSSSPSSMIDQLTLCEFMRKGHFSRHLRRMRKTHKVRRGVFSSCIERLLNEKIQIIGSNAGLHCSAMFLDARIAPDEIVCNELKSINLVARPLSKYYLAGSPADDVMSGLVMGFAHARPGEIKWAVGQLANIINRILKS